MHACTQCFSIECSSYRANIGQPLRLCRCLRFALSPPHLARFTCKVYNAYIPITITGMQTIHIYDAGTASLLICQVGIVPDLEAEAMRIAEKEGYNWGDCAWGGVDRFAIEVEP